MDLPDRHQTNDFLAEAPPPDPFSHSIPHQLYNHALQNAWVSFRYWDFLCRSSFINVPLQAPPAPGHGQPEGHHEDIRPPVGGVAAPGRVQDPHRIDMGYQGIVDYHPQPLAVSIFHLLLPTRLLIINDIRAIGPYIYIPGRRTRPRYPGTGATQRFSGYRLCFLNTFLRSRCFATGESRT
jgi:hypothetical protein